MKATKKALLMVLCAALLVAATVMGTIAYLTDTEAVTNTFTVGQVGLSLDEAKVNEAGEKLNNEGSVWEEGETLADRVNANDYHLLPGHTYVKDPTVHVDAKSEESYIRMIVKVENIASLEAAIAGDDYYADLNGDNDLDFALEKLTNGTWNYEKWHFVGYTEANNVAAYEFRYHTTVDNSDSNEDLELEPLFTQIKVPGEVTNTQLANLANVKIVVEAHAIQADGFNSADEAWANFS